MTRGQLVLQSSYPGVVSGFSTKICFRLLQRLVGYIYIRAIGDRASKSSLSALLYHRTSSILLFLTLPTDLLLHAGILFLLHMCSVQAREVGMGLGWGDIVYQSPPNIVP